MSCDVVCTFCDGDFEKVRDLYANWVWVLSIGRRSVSSARPLMLYNTSADSVTVLALGTVDLSNESSCWMAARPMEFTVSWMLKLQSLDTWAIMGSF
jgi:hypothetical protein